MLDDLRKGVLDDEPEMAAVANDDYVEIQSEKQGKRFLGMTAVERMFLMMFVFINVLVIGAALLLITGRLVL